MKKGFRQEQIRKVIRSRTIRTQDQLAEELASIGIEVTQVTLSRDIRELGVVKTAEGYREPSEAAAEDRRRTARSRFLQESVRDVGLAQNLVVLKTSPGGAPGVAAALDAESWPEVVGTVAGDDTIFVATRGASAAKRLHRKLLRFVLSR